MPSTNMSMGRIVRKLRKASVSAEQRALQQSDPREAILLLEHSALLSTTAMVHGAKHKMRKRKLH